MTISQMKSLKPYPITFMICYFYFPHNVTSNAQFQTYEKIAPQISCTKMTPLTFKSTNPSSTPSHPSSFKKCQMLTPHNGFICNLKCYIENEHLSAIVSHATLTFQYFNKWLTNSNIHPQWSNLIWTHKSSLDAQITQTLKFT